MNNLHIIENGIESNEVTKKIINSYNEFVIRTYCKVRFRIIPSRFLNEILQYIPNDGKILDLGCGFGLFLLYFAYQKPYSHFLGIDLNPKRIELARKSASDLGLHNIEFICKDIRDIDLHTCDFDVITAIDVFHHIPVEDGNRLLSLLSEKILKSNGIFIMKDVTTRPRYMLYFTYLLDWIMNPKDHFYYRDESKWKEALKKYGFRSTETHYLWDILPYPHILNVSRLANP